MNPRRADKCSLPLAALGIFLSAAAADPRARDEISCVTDSDCACGVHIVTGRCFYGNRSFVDASRECPDFCSGIAGHLTVSCVAGRCVQRAKKPPLPE